MFIAEAARICVRACVASAVLDFELSRGKGGYNDENAPANVEAHFTVRFPSMTIVTRQWERTFMPDRVLRISQRKLELTICQFLRIACGTCASRTAQ